MKQCRCGKWKDEFVPCDCDSSRFGSFQRTPADVKYMGVPMPPLEATPVIRQDPYEALRSWYETVRFYAEFDESGVSGVLVATGSRNISGVTIYSGSPYVGKGESKTVAISWASMDGMLEIPPDFAEALCVTLKEKKKIMYDRG